MWISETSAYGACGKRRKNASVSDGQDDRAEKAKKKNSQTVYSLLRRLWKRKIGIQKTEDIAGAACVDLKDPMHKVASEALKKRLPGEDLLMWDFPGKPLLCIWQGYVTETV